MKEEIKKKKINGFDMLIMKDDPGISRVLNKSKWFRKWHREPDFMDIIMEEVKPGMTVLDLGANIGYVSLLLGRLIGDKGFMYAAEPDIKNFNVITIFTHHYLQKINYFWLRNSPLRHIAKRQS